MKTYVSLTTALELCKHSFLLKCGLKKKRDHVLGHIDQANVQDIYTDLKDY